MAISTIKQSAAITTVTLGGSSYTSQVVYYARRGIKQSGRMTIQLTCTFSENIPAGESIASVPGGTGRALMSMCLQ